MTQIWKVIKASQTSVVTAVDFVGSSVTTVPVLSFKTADVIGTFDTPELAAASAQAQVDPCVILYEVSA